MLFKKEETKTIVASCGIFLLIKVISNPELPLLNSVAALVTVIIILMMTAGQKLSWTKVIAIIPAIIIITLEIVINIIPSVTADIVAVLVAALVIWTLFLYAFKGMGIYWEKCYPSKPRVNRMKKAFYIGLAIVLVAMLITAFFF